MKQTKRQPKLRKDRRNYDQQPPRLESVVPIHHTYRFIASAALAKEPITQTDVLGIAGGICSVVNNTVSLMSRAFKIHEIAIWSPGVTGPSSCTVEWVSAESVYATEVSDTTVSSAYPAHVRTRPPRGSKASWLLAGATGVLFNLTCAEGAVVDIRCSHYLNDSASGNYSATVAAGVVGVSYYLRLDNSGSGSLDPVGLNTTT